MSVSTVESAKITTITNPYTRNEKTHRILLCPQGRACADKQ
jgi:hypothetical protein